MDKFFDYVLLVFCALFGLTAIAALVASFFVENFLGLGTPASTICIASAFGGLYNSAICWALHKTLVYVSKKGK